MIEGPCCSQFDNKYQLLIDQNNMEYVVKIIWSFNGLDLD